MFVNIMLVLLFLGLSRTAYVLTHIARNQKQADANTNRRHSESILLLRGIKAVGIEEVEGNKRFTEALEAHTDALARFGSDVYDHQMSMETLAEAIEDNSKT